MSPNKVLATKSRSSTVNKKKVQPMPKNKKKLCKQRMNCATVSSLIGECSAKHVTSPRMLTRHFLDLIINELNNIAGKEKSQSKIGVINQISFDLKDFLTELDAPLSSNQPNNSNGDETSQNLIVVLKQALMELKKIDHNSISQRMEVYEKLESSTNFDLDLTSVGSETPSDILGLPNYTESHMIVASTSNSSSNQINYFDRSIVRGAALEAQLQLKRDEDMDVNVIDVNINKFSDQVVTHLKMVDDVLICACYNGSIVRFSFRGSVLPHLPHRTAVFSISQSPVADMLVWNNILLLGTVDGSVIKCTLGCKVLSRFPFNEEIKGITEIRGLLYVTTSLRKIHVLNIRSLTRFKDPVELGHVVVVIRSTVYKGSPVIVCLTDTGDIVGSFITDGCIGSPAFKYKSVSSLFEMGMDHNSSTVSFFCASSFNVTCHNLLENSVSQGVLANVSATTMLPYKQFLFVGSQNGDILIINIMNKYTYFYRKIVHGKIISLAYHQSTLYIGSDNGLNCLCIDNNNIAEI